MREKRAEVVRSVHEKKPGSSLCGQADERGSPGAGDRRGLDGVGRDDGLNPARTTGICGLHRRLCSRRSLCSPGSRSTLRTVRAASTTFPKSWEAAWRFSTPMATAFSTSIFAMAVRSTRPAASPIRPAGSFAIEGGWQFEDVTGRAAAPGPSYAMGAAAGDFDGDGRIDLFVTGWRDQRLYRNVGNCRFEDVTGRAGLKSGLWSTSAAFADLDGDGDLDLYVANYSTMTRKLRPTARRRTAGATIAAPRISPRSLIGSTETTETGRSLTSLSEPEST